MWILISSTTANFFTSKAYIFKAKAKKRKKLDGKSAKLFLFYNHGQADHKGKTPVWIFELKEMLLVL